MVKEEMPTPTLQIPERSAKLLADIVTVYSETGQPVGSKVLAETSKLGLSAASMRNIMQDLEKAGLLTHPHTSAGRVPTESGFRFYTQNLIGVELEKNLKDELKSHINASKPVTTLMKDVSDVLGHITGCASLVTAPKFEKDPLEQVEFIRLSGDRVLVVMVTMGGTIENRIIDVPAFIDTDELNKASKELKKIIAGQTLDDARSQMISAIAEQRGRVNEMIDQMMAAAHEWGEPAHKSSNYSNYDGAMVVAGSTNLFQYPEIVRDKLQNLVRMFEEKRLLMALMEEVKRGKGVQIFIGNDSDVTAAADCSVVASAYGNTKLNTIGTLGVVGPMRMNYQQTVGVINYTSQLLSTALGQQEA